MAELAYLEDYKNYKQITNTVDDEKLEYIIGYVSQIVETYCNRNFLDYASSPGLTEYFDARNTEVWLSQFPILQITYLGVSEDAGKTWTELAEDDSAGDGFFVYYENGKVSTQEEDIPFLKYVKHPYRSLKITYTAGYSDADNLPADLKIAIYDLIHYYHKEEYTTSKALNAATLENPAPYNSVNFPPHIVRILNNYRVPYAYTDAL